MIPPPPLQPGDTIAIIAPAGALVDSVVVHKGLLILEQLGFRPLFMDAYWQGDHYLSNPDELRIRELENGFANPEIKAIMALRGGYGCLRMLPALDWEIFRKNPKFLIGFSDISILVNQIADNSGLITFHGPVLSTLHYSNRDSINRLHFCLRGNWQKSLQETVEILKAQHDTRGKLSCWNLTSLTSLLGTPFSPDLAGKILLLEDINEPPYRLDRLLTQLAHAGKLHQLSGLILGRFSAEHSAERREKQVLEESVWNRILELTRDQTYPIWADFPVGHGPKNLAMPIGAEFLMSSERAALILCHDN